MEFRSPLSRAQGLGSAHRGSVHWWQQRITALALLPLGLWFVFSLAQLPSAAYEDVRQWIAHPVNSVLLVSFTLMVFYHAALGLQVIIEDYIHAKWLHLLTTLALKSALFLLALATLSSILQILTRA